MIFWLIWLGGAIGGSDFLTRINSTKSTAFSIRIGFGFSFRGSRFDEK